MTSIVLLLAAVAADAPPDGGRSAEQVQRPVSGPVVGQRLPYRLDVELAAGRRIHVSSTIE